MPELLLLSSLSNVIFLLINCSCVAKFKFYRCSGHFLPSALAMAPSLLWSEPNNVWDVMWNDAKTDEWKSPCNTNGLKGSIVLSHQSITRRTHQFRVSNRPKTEFFRTVKSLQKTHSYPGRIWISIQKGSWSEWYFHQRQPLPHHCFGVEMIFKCLNKK